MTVYADRDYFDADQDEKAELLSLTGDDLSSLTKGSQRREKPDGPQSTVGLPATTSPAPPDPPGAHLTAPRPPLPTLTGAGRQTPSKTSGPGAMDARAA